MSLFIHLLREQACFLEYEQKEIEETDLLRDEDGEYRGLSYDEGEEIPDDFLPVIPAKDMAWHPLGYPFRLEQSFLKPS